MKTFIHTLKNMYDHIAKKKTIIEDDEKQNRWSLLVKNLNRYSLVFHIILSCFLCFVIECISRRSLPSAFSFADLHTKAFIYNAFIIFTSLSLVYLMRRRIFGRIFISGFWIFLGTINGCVLSKRITPFGYTDLKCIKDLLAMENTKYFTFMEAVMVLSVVAVFLLLCIVLFVKGPKFKGNRNRVLTPIFVAGMFFMLPVTTKAAQNVKILDAYFANIALGYENYGFVYGFSTSVVDRGMSKPVDYTEEKVNSILDCVADSKTTNINNPNIIVVLLESFIDPEDVKFLACSKDPVPNFHNLEKEYSSGYFKVPVVGAGTANTEFEVLTGMSLQYFGTGEYPYKTILKKTDCESIASNLASLGYGTHAVHNNGGNFYSRRNAFSMMGFDTFTSKEMMNIQEYTPLGDWPTDNILINETKKALDVTPEQSDFVYTITVQGHGTYPVKKIIANPEINVSGAENESLNNQWEYYVNEIHEVDKFIGNLTNMLSKRDENTIVAFFGDHLPTLGLAEEDMVSGNIFKTKYVTWNNFGLQKKDADIKAYELLANLTNQIGIHEGTVFKYQQRILDDNKSHTKEYKTNLENLQYDLLYGKRYAYGEGNVNLASELEMGVEDVVIDNFTFEPEQKYIYLNGKNFTKWSKVFVNGKRVTTHFVSDTSIKVYMDYLKDGDMVVVNQLGSEESVFRSSNKMIYEDSTYY